MTDSVNNRYVLIYHLGASFRAELVRHSGHISGLLSRIEDHSLGGDVCTSKLAEFLTDIAHALHGEMVSSNPCFKSSVWQGAEVTKLHLSTHEVMELRVIANDSGPDDSPVLEMEILRDKFEELAGPVVSETTRLVARMLGQYDLLPVDLEQLVLTGEACAMPMVSRILEERLRLKPMAMESLESAEQARLRFAVRGIATIEPQGQRSLESLLTSEMESVDPIPVPDRESLVPLPADIEAGIAVLEARAARWLERMHESDRVAVESMLVIISNARCLSDAEAANTAAEHLDNLLFAIIGPE
jgi:hypothetical protein